MLVQSHCCCHYRSPQARQTPMLAQLFFAHYTFESLSVMQSFWGPSQRWYYRESSTWRHNHASRKWMSQCAHCHAFPTSSSPSAERGGSLVSKKKKKGEGEIWEWKTASVCLWQTAKSYTCQGGNPLKLKPAKKKTKQLQNYSHLACVEKDTGKRGTPHLQGKLPSEVGNNLTSFNYFSSKWKNILDHYYILCCNKK